MRTSLHNEDEGETRKNPLGSTIAAPRARLVRTSPVVGVITHQISHEHSDLSQIL